MTIPRGDMCDGCTYLERRDDAEVWHYCRKHKVEVQGWLTQFGDLHVLKCKVCLESSRF